ncbi:transcriptional regulator [Candidatus Gottesmanbacteria bacterium RBG_13_45_10]|uniref:Transcriptional regulator n=1 Tax=Candidatus Gottesmanbacteria bacterium RBG_13_45_10 TaxID=1798370 RepID=A0A1F5ZGV8_9BACT|nr:MAG: transcriptional regulator [Candidatus Gottesmanbacteria bacterium RBG_13_45_10]
MKSYTQFKKELLTDREIKRAYDALAPEYAVIQAVIEKRLEKKMTQKELAQKVGTRQSAISRLESGGANPSVRFLQKIASAFGAQLIVGFK